MDLDTLTAAFQQESSNERIETPAPEASPEATPSLETPAPLASATVNETKPSPVSLADDALVEFKLNGQTVSKTWKEILQTQAMLPGDYTRKSQALAAERKTYQTEREQFDQARAQYEAEKQALAAALRDPRKIEALYLAAVAAANGQTTQAPNQATPPGQPPTQFDPNQLLQTVEQRINARLAEMEQTRINAERGNVLERHVESILSANPALKSLPNINDYLYNQVISMVEPGRTTVDEAQRLLDTVAQGVMASLNEHFSSVKKEDAVKQGLLKNGIERGPSAAPVPAAKKYDRKKGLDDPEMEADILAYVKAQHGVNA